MQLFDLYVYFILISISRLIVPRVQIRTDKCIVSDRAIKDTILYRCNTTLSQV